MTVRLLLVLLTLTGLVPAGECACAACVAARQAAAARPDAGPARATACPADHDHDHDAPHPAHHHSDCPSLDAWFGPPPAVAPSPLGEWDPGTDAVATRRSSRIEPSAFMRRVDHVSRRSAPALPLYLSQSTLLI